MKYPCPQSWSCPKSPSLCCLTSWFLAGSPLLNSWPGQCGFFGSGSLSKWSRKCSFWEELPIPKDSKALVLVLSEPFIWAFNTWSWEKSHVFSAGQSLQPPRCPHWSHSCFSLHWCQCTRTGECFLVEPYFQVNLSSLLSGIHVGGGAAALFLSLLWWYLI